MNPCAGYDPHEIIDVRPLVNELATLIIGSKEFYDLPRKFNIAYDGGGLISAVEDTNDIGASAVKITENSEGIEPGVYFRIALGGVTGHQTFASDWGVIVKPEQLNDVMVALLRVFIEFGDRTNRKKARFKYVIEDKGLDGVLVEAEKHLKFKLTRLAPDSPIQEKRDVLAARPLARRHLSAEAGRAGLCRCHRPRRSDDRQAARPAGRSRRQLRHRRGAAHRLAELHHSRTSKRPMPPPWRSRLKKLGFPCETSHLRNGFIACTGNKYCKFAASDTKGHAIAMMDYLDKRVKLDKPVNVHFTGCAHSCAQHFMGDIGLLGTKVKSESGEGYHITVGGGFGENRKIGRQIFSGVAFESRHHT